MNHDIMKINKSISHTVLFCFATMAAIPGFSQTGNLPVERVEVVKIFEAKLAESEKVHLIPELPKADSIIKKQNYSVPTKSLTMVYPAPRIRPVSYKTGEEIPEVYKAFGRLGAGLPESILGEGAYRTIVKPSDKTAYDVGLNVYHHSADFSDGDVENQRFGLTKIEGNGTYYFQQGFATSAKIGYQSDRVHYYGYSTDKFNNNLDVPAESVKQNFGTFDLGLQFFNGKVTQGDFDYRASLDYYNHADDYASRENGLDFGLGATKWFKNRHSLDFGLQTDFTWYNDTMVNSQTLHNYTLPLAFTYHGKTFKVKLGGKVISHDDEYFPFPDLEAMLNLTGNELAIYIGVNGDLKKNTFRSLSDYNPYIHTRLPSNTLRNTKYFRVYAGVKGNMKLFEYTVEASYKPTNDLPLYRHKFRTADKQDIRYDFDVVYDDVDIINISGSIKATPIKGLELTGTLSQNIYDTRSEAKAWHLPSLEANIQALYVTKNNKLRGKAQLFIENGVPSNDDRAGENRWNNLNSLIDLNLGAEYWFGKHFGAFIEGNNLFNNKRQRWRYYPTYGINALAGVTFRF
jgi:hypothetical protein